MDPDPSTARGWSSVADAASWAGLSDTCRQSFFTHFGITAEDHPRVIAITPSEEFETILRLCSKDNEQSVLTRADVNKLRLFARACRVACGLIDTSAPRVALPVLAKKKRKRSDEESQQKTKKTGLQRDQTASLPESTCLESRNTSDSTPSSSRDPMQAMHAVELFEVASGSEAGDEAERRRREGALLQNSANVSEDSSLSRAATIYIAATREFAEHQLGLEVLRANLASHLCRKEERLDAELSSNIVTSYGVALRELLALSGPLDADSLRSAHSNLAGLRNGKAGEFRSGGVRAGLSNFPKASEVPALVDHFCRNLVVAMAKAEASAAAKAAWALYWFTAIHPFGDGNGRLGCIIANWVLRQCGIPFVCHFCTTAVRRQDFVAALKEGHARAGMDLSRITLVVASAVVSSFDELQQVVQRHRSVADASLADTAVRQWRADRCAEVCLICHEESPNMATLCCGQPLHFDCFHRALALGTVSRCPGCRKELPRQDSSVQGVSGQDARISSLASSEGDIDLRAEADDSGETTVNSDSTTTDSGDTDTTADSTDNLQASHAGDTEPILDAGDLMPASDGADTEVTSVSPATNHVDNDSMLDTADSEDTLPSNSGDTEPILQAGDTTPSLQIGETEATLNDEDTLPTPDSGDTQSTPDGSADTPDGDTSDADTPDADTPDADTSATSDSEDTVPR